MVAIGWFVNLLNPQLIHMLRENCHGDLNVEVRLLGPSIVSYIVGNLGEANAVRSTLSQDQDQVPC